MLHGLTQIHTDNMMVSPTPHESTPPAGRPSVIEGVVGVIIWTDDLDRLQAFYRDALGLTPHSVRPDFVSFKWGDMRFSIGTHSHVEGQTREPYRVMVNLGTADIHGTYESLLARGVDFSRPPEKEHWGGWVATLSDPDGNTLQLMQQPDA